MSEAGWNRPVDQDPVTVGTDATPLITTPERAGRPRKGVEFTPIDGDIWYGGIGVSATSQPASQGQTVRIASERGQIYAIRQAGADVLVHVTPWY